MGFLLASLAVYRIVRLWRFDTIAEPIRSRVIGSDDGRTQGWLLGHPTGVSLWLLDLLTCPWCLSVHVAFWGLRGASAAGWVGYDWSWAGATGFVVAWMALSAVGSWCFLIEDRLAGPSEDEDERF